MPVDLLKGGAPKRPDRSLEEILVGIAMASVNKKSLELSVAEVSLLSRELIRLSETEWMYNDLKR